LLGFSERKDFFNVVYESMALEWSVLRCWQYAVIFETQLLFANFDIAWDQIPLVSIIIDSVHHSF